MWRSLLDGQDLLLKWCHWQVHSGSKIDVWKDTSIRQVPGFKIQSPEPPLINLRKVSNPLSGVKIIGTRSY